MHQHYRLILLLFLIAFSCSKKNEKPPEPAVLARIIYGDPIGLGTYEATYQDGLLTELSSVYNDEKIVFEYTPRGYISLREFYALSTGKLLVRDVYQTNSAGKILVKRQWRSDQNNLYYEGRKVYEYLNGTLDKILYYGPDDISVYNTMTFAWQDNNPVQIKWFGQTDTPQYTTEITYDLSKENTFNISYPNSSELYAFEYDFLLWQSMSKYIPTSSVTYFNSGPNTVNYNYTLLPNGLTDAIYYNDQLWLTFEYKP